MSTIDKWSDDNGVRRREELTMERARTAQLAHQLSSMAIRQWEKALTGMVALPAAAAMSVAATATYGVSVLERGFELFESAIGEVGRTVANADHGGALERRAERPEARA